MLVRQNNMQNSIWIRAKPTTYPGMHLSHLIYSAAHSPVLALYISFDLLTLMVSLKISSFISSAILKPLILPEREEKGGSSFPVWCLSDIFHWPVTQWAVIASRTHRAGRGIPSIGHRAPLSECCIAASLLSQESEVTKKKTTTRMEHRRLERGALFGCIQGSRFLHLHPVLRACESILQLCGTVGRAVASVNQKVDGSNPGHPIATTISQGDE